MLGAWSSTVCRCTRSSSTPWWSSLPLAAHRRHRCYAAVPQWRWLAALAARRLGAVIAARRRHHRRHSPARHLREPARLQTLPELRDPQHARRPVPALGAAGVRWSRPRSPRGCSAGRRRSRRRQGRGRGRDRRRRLGDPAAPRGRRVTVLVCGLPHRRLRAHAPSGAGGSVRLRLRPRLASSRRNDSTRSGSASPAATASSSPHSGSSAPWVQPRGQSSVISSRSGNASIRSSGRTCASPNDRMPGRVDDPARRRRAGQRAA